MQDSNYPSLAAALVHERERDVVRESSRRRLVALALAASVMDRDVVRTPGTEAHSGSRQVLDQLKTALGRVRGVHTVGPDVTGCRA